MTAWATDLEFAYDHGHLYVLDAGRHWSEADVDVRMPRSANFFVPLRVEGWGGRPPLDLDAWDHVVEFSLPVPSGKLALASGGIDEVTVGIAPGAYRARWSGRNLSAAATWESDDRTRPTPTACRSGPGPATAPRAEIKRWAGAPARRARRPAGAAGRRASSTRSARSPASSAPATGCASTSASRAPTGAAGTARSAPTASCAGSPRAAPFDRATLHAEHPGLLPYADERGGLSFRGRPADPERLAHALRDAHVRARRPHIAFEDVVNTIFAGRLELLLSLGFGQLANGPVTLLRRYAEVASAHGVATTLIVTGPGRAGLSLLELGDSFVVAERFSALLELAAARNSSFWRFSPLAWTAA